MPVSLCPIAPCGRQPKFARAPRVLERDVQLVAVLPIDDHVEHLWHCLSMIHPMRPA